MKELSISDYLIDGTQKEIAEALHITDGAVSQMVKFNRDVRLIVNKRGEIVRAHEIKQLPARNVK